MAAIACWLLQRTILRQEGHNSVLAAAVGCDLKDKISPMLYLIAIPAAFVSQWIAGGL